MKKIINYFIANLFPSFTAYLLLPIYGFYLSKSEYGAVGKLEVFTYVFSILSLLALDRGVIKYYFESKKPKERKVILSTILWMSALFSLAFVCICYLLIKSEIFYVDSYVNALFYLVLSVAITNQSLIVGRIMQARGDSFGFLLMQAVRAISILIFSYLYVAHLSSGVNGYAKGLLVSSLILFPFIINEYRKYLKLTFSLDVAISVLKFCIPFMPTLLAAWLFSMYGRVVIEEYSGLDSLGEFTMSFKISSVLLMVNTAIVLTFTPYFLKSASEGLADERLSVSISMIQYTSFFIFILFSFLVNDLVGWFLPEKYNGIGHYIVLLNAALFVSCSMSYSSNLIYLHFKKTLQHMLIYIGVGVVAAGLNYVLGRPFGVLGVCSALLVSNCILYFIHTFYCKKFSMIDSPHFLFILLASFMMIIVGFFGGGVSSLGLEFIVLKFVLALVVFVVVSFRTLATYKKRVIEGVL